VREKLDYLVDLGVNALYLTPIFTSTANHRYHTHDYFKVDPILGGDDAFRNLLNSAHQRGIRVVIDGVFNHASRGFYQFNHTLENGRHSPYLEWFHFNANFLENNETLRAYPDTHADEDDNQERCGYRAWWNLPALPKFNTDHPEVRDFLFRVAEYWVDFGIDGWRLDVPAEIDDDAFWQEFRRRVKRKNPDAYICGEIWHDASRWLKGDQFDAVMNYLFTKAAIGFCMADTLNEAEFARCGYEDIIPLDAHHFGEKLLKVFKLYDRNIVECQMNLLGSHDTPRILNSGLGEESATKMAFTCMFTVPGAPCIYYGDEIGIAGNHDPDCRRSFDWDKATWNTELLTHVKACVAARHRHPSLRRGDFHLLIANDGVVAYERSYGDDKVIICLNSAQSGRDVSLRSKDLRDGQIFRDLLSGVTVAAAAGALHPTIPARASQIWVGAQK